MGNCVVILAASQRKGKGLLYWMESAYKFSYYGVCPNERGRWRQCHRPRGVDTETGFKDWDVAKENRTAKVRNRIPV
jgi:hypothetical protein